MAPFDPNALIGLVLEGRYRVERVVGDGGHGVVLRAEHLSLGTPVALKVLRVPPELPTPMRDRLLSRIREEGRLLHALSRTTPAVVQALDVFSVELPGGAWAPCLVMEWLDGVTLAEALANGHLRTVLFGEPARTGDRLAPAEVVRALAPLADALAHAHAAGIAHRDVKPSNVMLVGRQPLVKLLDFGIAKVMRTQADDANAFDASGDTLVAFSPAYAAPEQIEPSYGATGPWTDVFALALLVVELVSGRRALGDGSSAECARRALDPETRPTPRALGVEVGDAVESVLRRALAVDPRNRPRTADELWRELSDASVSAAPATERTAPTTLETSGRRNTAAATTGAETVPPIPAPPPPWRVTTTSRRRDRSSVVVGASAVGVALACGLAWLALRPPREGGDDAPVTEADHPAATTARRSRAKTPRPPAPSTAACGDATRMIPGRRVCLDRFEVTVAEYASALPGSERREQPALGAHCNDAADAPANCVSLAQARLFCKVAGGRLPTREEWSDAAAALSTRPVADAREAAGRAVDAAAETATDCTDAGICGLASGVSEFVEAGAADPSPCLMGLAFDSGFNVEWLTRCRRLPWMLDENAGRSSGLRCAYAPR